MSSTDMIDVLRKIGQFGWVSHVTTFTCTRTTKHGFDQTVTVEVLDAGPDVQSNLRYTCVGRAPSGKGASGNPAATIEEAVAVVHWGDLD